MKRIIITESQYKRLVSKKLNEEISLTGDKITNFDVDLEGKIIKRWNKNDRSHVKRIQKMLLSLDYDLGSYGENRDGVDGIYGPFTENAVEDFQEDVFPHEPDLWTGVIDYPTYEKLFLKVTELAEENDNTLDEFLDTISPTKIDSIEYGINYDLNTTDVDMDSDISGDLSIKGNELTSGGEISSVWNEILNDLDDQLDNLGIKYKITAGNDNFHKKYPKSRHAIGCAVDFSLVLPGGQKTFNNYSEQVYEIMSNLESKYGSNYNFSWIDEYNNPSSYATGGHIHMSIDRQFCGQMASGKENKRDHDLPMV